MATDEIGTPKDPPDPKTGMGGPAKGLLEFLKRAEDIPTAMECAVMLALIVVVCIVAISTVPQPLLGAEKKPDEPPPPEDGEAQ